MVANGEATVHRKSGVCSACLEMVREVVAECRMVGMLLEGILAGKLGSWLDLADKLPSVAGLSWDSKVREPVEVESPAKLGWAGKRTLVVEPCWDLMVGEKVVTSQC